MSDGLCSEEVGPVTLLRTSETNLELTLDFRND
jgi:hypothetical protein